MLERFEALTSFASFKDKLPVAKMELIAPRSLVEKPAVPRFWTLVAIADALSITLIGEIL